MKDLNFYSRPVWVLFTSLSHSQVTWKIREQVMGRKEALGGRWSLPSQVLASATPSPPNPTASFQHCLASPSPSLPLAWPGRDFHLLFPHDTAAFPLTLSFYLKS